MAVLWIVTLMCVATLGHAASVGAKDEDTSYDTIVVGLGAAGTTAATTLARAGKRVLALEAQDRIGGRVRTVPCGKDGVVELGAEWIHGTEGSPTYKLALDNNVTILAQNDLESGVWSDGSTADAELVGELITFVMDSVNALPEAPEPVGEFVTKRLRAYLSENHPELLNNKEFMDAFLIFADLLMDSYDGSDSWNDATTHGRYEQLGGSQLMSWHKIGYKTLFEILLNKYKDGPGLPNLTVKLNTEVTHISWPIDPRKKVVVTTKDGAEFTADNVIVTVSVGVLKERYASLFTPRLPPKKVTAIETITLGVVDKIVLLFSEPWWPEFSSFGFLWRDADRKATPEEDKWYTMVAGVSAPMGCANALTLWTNGATSRHIETLPEEEVKTKSMELLRKFLGHNFTIPDAIGIWRTNWYSNPYTRGSYSFDNLVTPEHMTNRDDLAEPLTDTAGKPRVLFAGEASNLHHFSTVHGAVETGQREAARLLNQKVEVAPSTGKVIKSKDRRGMTNTTNTVVGAI